jgi:hypothetical protein
MAMERMRRSIRRLTRAAKRGRVHV